ncbi:MAG: DUF938 domain-containing protein [Nannocystaceae bacterium]
MTDLDDERRFAPAASRNRAPIYEVLAPWLPAAGTILEIGCGTGEHAVFIAPRRPGLRWQPTDPEPAARRSVDAWARHVSAVNIAPAIELDAAAPAWPSAAVDGIVAILAINVIHISPWSTCLGIFAGAARSGASLVFLYGPYKVDGAHTAPSNAGFDDDLRARDPRWGVRDRGEVAAVADAAGFDLVEVAAMPANNFTLVFRRRAVEPVEKDRSPGTG